MKKIKALTFVSIIIAMLLVSIACSETEEGYDYRYDGRIYFTFRYDSLLSAEDDYVGFRLYLSTEEIFPCVQYSIVTEEEYGSDQIDVHILDIDEIDPCYTALGPAKRQISINFAGISYKLVFHNSTLTNTHQISILSDSVAVVVGDTSFTNYDRERAIYP